METKPKDSIYQLTMCALMAAVMCVLSPFSIPIGPVPISLGTFTVYLAVYLLGWKLGTVSLLVYLLLGMAGLPVFSGFGSGIAKLAGPTGGYLIGYIPMAVIGGLTVERTRNRVLQFIGYVIATAVCYFFGTAWFCIQAGYTVGAALAVCVFPFIIGDLIKIALAVLLGAVVKSRLVQAGIWTE